jgi:hypothetical protein
MKKTIASLGATALIAAFALVGFSTPAQAATGDVIVPTSGFVTGYVGAHCDGSNHDGIDIAASAGTSIVAGAAGTVKTVVNSSGTTYFGTYVVISHGAGYETLYGHMLVNSPTVSEGQTVAKGQRIGSVGNTGASRGNHLHFEVQLNSKSESGLNSYFTCGKTVTQGTPIPWSFPGFPGGGGGGGMVTAQPGVAIRTNTGGLWSWGGAPGSTGVGANSGLGVMAGTSPASVTTGSSQAIAFVGSGSSSLWTWSGQPGRTGVGANANVGVLSGTSPSMTRLANGTYAVAFNASDGNLWIWKGAPGTVGFAERTGYGMKAGTSPSVRALGDRIVTAFQANTGVLHIWAGNTGSNGGAKNVGQNVRTGTSPALTTVGANLSVAYNQASGGLGIWNGAPLAAGSNSSVPLGITGSPAITTVGSRIAIAFNATGNTLWHWVGTASGSGLGYNQSAGMKAGSSPSIVAVSDSQTATAFQANTGELYTMKSNPAGPGAFTGAKLGMSESPSIG